MKLKIAELDLGFHNKLFEIPTKNFKDKGTIFKEKVIKLILTLTKRNKHYSLKGTLFAVPEYSCVRCLTKIPFQLRLPIKIAISQITKKLQDDMDTIYFDNQEESIDLNEILADIIALEEPIKPLCNKGCKGLCSICGLKKELSCTCKEEKYYNNEWNKLKDLQIK